MSDGSPSNATPPDPLLGKRFHEWNVERLIGAGGMGSIYLVRSPRLPNRPLVLKVIHPMYVANAQIRARFDAEAQAASMVKHDRCLEILALGEIEGQPCILMPLLDGQSLEEYLRQHGPLRPHHALHVAAQVADALDHIHAVGLVHRDLKPANVFLEAGKKDQLSIKVMDFGIAKRVGASRGALTLTAAGPSGGMGTPSYMAVEQHEMARDATSAADVYALAILIWEVTSGALPWRADSIEVLYHQKMTEPPTVAPGRELPVEWLPILSAALSVNPAARPDLATLMLDLGSALPALGAWGKSGAQIVRDAAPQFFSRSREGETVQHRAERAPEPQPHWALTNGGPSVSGLPPLPVVTSSALTRTGSAAGPTANLHGQGAPVVAGPTTPTTLGGAAGAMVPRSARASRARIATFGAAVVIVGAITAFAVLRVSHSDGENSAPASAPVVVDGPSRAPDAVQAVAVPDAAPAVDAAPDAAPVDAAAPATAPHAAGTHPPSRPPPSHSHPAQPAASSPPSGPTVPAPNAGSGSAHAFDPEAPLGGK